MLQSPLLAKGYRQKSLLSLPCALRVSGPLRDYSCKIFSSRFPAHASVKHLLILLLLSSDIALNQGPINFALFNCHSIRSKGPWIGDTIASNNLDILVLAESHFHKCTHFHGHILDLILSASDSSFASNLTVGELVSGHAVVKCHLDLSKPLKLVQPTLNCVRCSLEYHKISPWSSAVLLIHHLFA